MKNKVFFFFFTLSFLILFQNCNDKQNEVAAIAIDKLSTKQELNVYESKPIQINKDDKIYFWSYLDIEYADEISLRCQVELYNEVGEKIYFLEMNPFDIDIRSMCTEGKKDGWTKYICTGRIHNFISPESFDFLEFEDPGRFYFKVIMFSNSYDDIDLNKAIIIVKK